MADSQRIFDPGKPFLDANSTPISGGSIEFYLAGTTTPLEVFSDADLTVSLGTSVTLDSGGFPVTGGSTLVAIYTGTASYKIVIKTSGGSTFATYDNLKGALDTSGYTTTYAIQTSPVLSKTAAYTVQTADKGKHIAADPSGGTFAITLLSAITAGDGFIIEVSHNADSDNPVSILPQAGQTIDGKSSQVLTRRQSTMLVADGANWRIKSRGRPFYETLIRITDRLTAAPSSPTAGARYIINGTPTGTWSTLGFAQHDVVESDGNGGWIQWVPQDGWQAYVLDENLVTVFIDTAWEDWSNVTAPTTSALKCAVYEDQKSNGTAGGAATTGSYQTRTLNTEVKNTITGVSLASNQITLPPGTYLINFWQTLYNVGSSASKIKVISGTATPTNIYASWSNHALSDSGGATSSDYDATISTGILTVTATAVIELQYYAASTAGAGNALGLASAEPDGSVEVYARVTLVELTSIQGPTGAQGTQGTDGLDASYSYQWSTSTSGDPGSGKISGDNATIASITQLAISETDAAGASLGSAVLGSWDDSTSSNKARIIIQKEGATQNRHEFLITGAGTDQGAYWTFPVSYVSTAGTISNGNSVAVNVVEKGDKGDAGATGPVGSTSFTYSTTTADADPGSGIFRLNNATPASATAAYVDNNNRGGSDVSAWLDTLDDNGNSTLRGTLYMMDAATPQTVFRIYSVSGSVVDGTGYRKLTLTHVTGAGSFTNGNEILFAFIPRGPAGTGDLTSTNNLSDVANVATAATNLGLGTGSSPQFTAVNLGHATDTTIARVSAGVISVEGETVHTNSTSRTLTAQTIELGAAADTTIARSAAGKITVEGSMVKLAGTETIWIPAVAMTARTTNGAAAGTVESTTNKIMQKSLDFDAATAEYAQFAIRMPKSWNEGTVTASFTWTANSTSTNSVVWGLQGVAIGNDETIDTAFGTAQTVTDANTATAYQAHTTTATSAITIGSSPAAQDWVVFQAYRDATNGSDTLAVDAMLLGVTLYITTDDVNDA